MTWTALLRRFNSLQPRQRQFHTPIDALKIPLSLVLTLPFVVLTAGATGLVGYLCIRNGQQAVVNLAHQLMTETGDRVNLYLSEYLEMPQRINRLNANAVRLGQIDITDPESLKRHFVQQIQAFDAVSRIHFSNPQGGYVSAGDDERGLSTATTDDFVKGLLRVYTVDGQGNRKALVVEQPDYDASQRPFYQRAIEVGQPVWTPIYVYVPAARGLGISASYPLYDQKQQVQGVLSSDLTLVAISQFLEKLPVGTEGTVFIVDRSGRMVASSTPEPAFFTHASSNPAQLNATASRELPIRLSTQHLMAQFGDLSKITTAAQLKFEIAGKRQFLQVAPFRDQFGLDWLIVVTVPETDFMGQIAANTQNTMLLSLAALLGAVSLGLVLAHGIARSIQRLSRASQLLAMGEWHESLQDHSPIAELQVLTQSFNQTAMHLQQSFDRVCTARQQAEVALQQNEARFQRLAAAAPGAIYTLVKHPERSFYFEYVSPAIQEINELTVEQMLNEPALNLIHPEDQAGYEAAVAYSAITLQAFAHEFRIITPSGKLKWLQANSRPEQRPNGEIAWYGIVLDVSDRKQAETALRHSEATKNQILKAIPDLIIWMTADGNCIDFMDGSSVTNLYTKSEAVGKNLYELLPLDLAQARMNAVRQALRTGEVQIYEQQLLIQGKVCYEEVRVVGVGGERVLVIVRDITERQTIDRMKNEFVSIVSHELRTPLTAIRGFLGLLDTGIYDNKPDKARYMLRQALTNSDRLVRLVNDILDLERLSSGRAQFVMEPCGAETLMQQAAAGVQSLADQATVTLATVPTTAQVWADSDSIIQTLTNLLSNAIKFSPPHSVIALSAQVQSERVLFAVTDQGRGIPMDKLETIFGRFQQVDASDSRQKGGTGLGLAICQSIVQQHGGNIWVESTFGAGSTFYFTLPFPPGGAHD